MNELRGDHVGIVVFAGEAYKQLPLTPDYQVAKLFLKNIGTDMISSQGTDIGNAIELCMSSFSDERKNNKAIVIISDGEDHEEMAVNAAKEANEEGVVICTVGMGSGKGVPIPIVRNGKKIGIKDMTPASIAMTKAYLGIKIKNPIKDRTPFTRQMSICPLTTPLNPWLSRSRSSS